LNKNRITLATVTISPTTHTQQREVSWSSLLQPMTQPANQSTQYEYHQHGVPAHGE